MKNMFKTLIVLIALIAFIALAYYSYNREVNYTPAQISAMNRLVAESTLPKKRSHSQRITQGEKNQMIVYLYGAND